MPSAETDTSRTVEDTARFKTDEVSAAQQIIGDIFYSKNRDSVDRIRLEREVQLLNDDLQNRRLLPSLDIIAHTQTELAVESNSRMKRSLAADQIRKTLTGEVEYAAKISTGADGGTKKQEGNDKSGITLEDGVTRDSQGRITAIWRPTGSISNIEYEGADKNPNKIITTNKDGSTITFQVSGERWTETTKSKKGAETSKINLSAVLIDEHGNITARDAFVTKLFTNDGKRVVTTGYASDTNQFERMRQFSYDSNGELGYVDLQTKDGQREIFIKEKSSNKWTMQANRFDGYVAVSNVRYNPDGGISYDAGSARITVTASGGAHVLEKTSYGTYEQSFASSGKLTNVVRNDNTRGKLEFVDIFEGTETLSIYDAKNPSNNAYYSFSLEADGSYTYRDQQGREVQRSRDFKIDGLRQTPIDAAFTEAAQDNDLDLHRRIVNGHFVYDYSVIVNHDRSTLLTSGQPAAAIGKQLLQLRDQKLAAVELQYGVSISRDALPSAVSGVASFDGEFMPTKAPNLGQLYGVESALRRSSPDIELLKNGPLQIHFLKEQGKIDSVLGYAQGNQVVIEPNGSHNADLVEETTLHEIAHIGQFSNLNSDSSLSSLYAARFGFVKANNNWLLISKDGRYFKSVPGKNGLGSAHWVRADKDANPVDENGINSASPQTVSNREASDLALIKPASLYFPNPTEAGAEATRLFRSGKRSRMELLLYSPDTYNAIKQIDQLLLNKRYGVGADGEPKYIRNQDGVAVMNGPEERKKIHDFEYYASIQIRS